MTWEEQMINREGVSPLPILIEKFNTPVDMKGKEPFEDLLKQQIDIAIFNRAAKIFNTPVKKETTFWYKVYLEEKRL